MIRLQSISLFLIVLLALAAVALYLFFWICRRQVIPLIKSRSRQNYWQAWLLRAELAAWSGLVLFGLYLFLLEAPVVTVVLAGLVIIAGRQWWRDFFAGLLFRLDRDTDVGDYLYHQGQQYRIDAIRSRSLKLNDDQGKTLILPYRLIEEVMVTKVVRKTPLTPFTFQVENPSPDAAAQIEHLLAECPWTAPAHPPKIKSLGEGRYQITSAAPNEQIREKQQRYLRERLELQRN